MLVGFLIKIGENNEAIAIRRRRREGFENTGFDNGSEVETVVFDDVDFVWTGDDEMVGVGIPRKVGGLEGIGLIFKFLDESKEIVTKGFNLNRSLVS